LEVGFLKSYLVKRMTARQAKISPRTFDTVMASFKKMKPRIAGMMRFRLKIGMTTERGPRAMAV
jgi:hypothetical protein